MDVFQQFSLILMLKFYQGQKGRRVRCKTCGPCLTEDCGVCAKITSNIQESSVPSQGEEDKKDVFQQFSLILMLKFYQGRKGRRVRCKTCGPCLTEDCRVCANCLDKPRFGGQNRRKQACIKRKCVSLTTTIEYIPTKNPPKKAKVTKEPKVSKAKKVKTSKEETKSASHQQSCNLGLGETANGNRSNSNI